MATEAAPEDAVGAQVTEAPLPGLRDLPTRRGGAAAGEADPFASLDLPPSPSAPTEAQPPVKKGGDRRDIFAEITDETISSAGKPTAVDPGGGEVDDLATEPGPAQAVGSAGGTSFGEISLADSPDGVDVGEAGVDLPERKYRGGKAGDEDAGLELDSLAAGQASERYSGAPAASSVASPAKAEEEKPRSSMRSLLILLMLIALGGGGAALYFTGLYMDVYKFGSKLIGRDIDAMMAERASMLADVGKGLSGDNFEAYSSGVDRLQKSVRATSDNVVRAYTVYLAYSLQIRFGDLDTFDKIAEAELRKVSLGKDLEREQVLALNAKLIFDRKDEAAAISKLEGLNRTLGGKDVDILALLGLAGLRKGDGSKAFQSYSALAGVEKDSARAQFGMVRALLMQGKTEDAEKLLTSMLESHPEHMDSKILKAKLLLRKGTVDQAEVMLDGIAKVGEGKLGPSQSSTVDALLGQIYLGRQETTKALKLFTEADKMDPNNAEALIGLGQIHLMRNEPGKALSRYKMARVVAPNNEDAVLGITMCQIELAAFTEADALLKGLLGSHPEDYRVHHLIGRYTQALKDDGQASIAYKKAIELNPAHLQSYLDLASMYFEIDRVSDALVILEQAKEKLPPTANLYAAFGQGYIERDELDNALVEIEAALEADPEHVQAHFLQGVALFKLVQYADAEVSLTW
ncbi:MAG: tetratricopeptide repeat protein, partial [Deltaproteobacteria bacterium]|nr:tetratricopeptide repeat protein [Deltaproteobacteria bacterium]